MLTQIQKTVKNYLDACDLTDITYGQVTSIEPLKIKINQRLELPHQVLLLTSNVIHKSINIKHKHLYKDSSDSGTTQKETDESFLEEIVITEGLKIDDNVLLLKVINGQKYIVLDKLQEGG